MNVCSHYNNQIQGFDVPRELSIHQRNEKGQS